MWILKHRRWGNISHKAYGQDDQEVKDDLHAQPEDALKDIQLPSLYFLRDGQVWAREFQRPEGGGMRWKVKLPHLCHEVI